MIWKKAKENDRLCETLACLHQIPLFSSLSVRELRRLEPIFHDRRYDTGEVIFDQGEEGLGMYVVVSGKVRIFTKAESPDGSEKELALLGTGQFFGELALLDGEKRTASAIAVEPSRLVGFFRPEFLSVLETHGRAGTKISLQLAKLTAFRLRQTLEGPATTSSI
ncbi:MAG: cyclic nucleotide-binding domain-containing protein [Verrucomicrobiota bacterium]